jgi:hypothetical protein
MVGAMQGAPLCDNLRLSEVASNMFGLDFT